MTEYSLPEKYEIAAWIDRLGSKPVRTVAKHDRSEGYDIDEMLVLALENGQYATVLQSGCSCYDSSEASIDLHPSQAAALAQLEKWIKGN